MDREEFYPHHLPMNIMAANFVDLTISSREMDIRIKVSPYECCYGFRSSKFLQDLLVDKLSVRHSSALRKTLTHSSPAIANSLTTYTKIYDELTVIEDSSTQDIRAALEYIHKGLEGLNFSKVSAIKYAKTAQYLMIESLLDYLIVLGYNTITGQQVDNVEDLYRRPGDRILTFPQKRTFSFPKSAIKMKASQHEISSWEAYFVLRQLGYTTSPTARIRLQLDDWVGEYPELLRDPKLYEHGPTYLTGDDIARLVRLHIK